MKKIIFAFFKLTRLHVLIQKMINAERISISNKQVTNNGATFYPEATVENLLGDPTKIQLGRNTQIRGNLLILSYGGNIVIGENSFVGKFTNIWSANSIFIGNSVLISHGVNIIDTNSHETDYLERAKSFNEMITVGHPDSAGNVPNAPIIIEDNVWINFNVTILKGVRVGEGAIIAANSLVLKDVPPFTVVGGSPAKIIKTLNSN